jgi:hypothetical protein
MDADRAARVGLSEEVISDETDSTDFSGEALIAAMSRGPFRRRLLK